MELKVDKVLIVEKICTPGGDIAYHVNVNDQTERFEEGETVALLQSCDGTRQTIEKLTRDNFKQHKVKGVITESQYFEAHKPTIEG